MLALCRRAPNRLIQLLLQSGADPHLSDGHDRTALYYAVREQNVWAIKWLVTGNVDIDTPVGGHGESRPVFRHLLNYCDVTFIWGSKDFSPVLNYLRAMQVLVLAGTNHLGNSFVNKWTQTQLMEWLSSIILRTVELSKAPCFRTYEMMVQDLQEIRDIVHALTDMLSNPLPLSHLCRVQIRRSLGRDFHEKLDQLNVPLPIQEYLKIYKESDIILWFLSGEYVLD